MHFNLVFPHVSWELMERQGSCVFADVLILTFMTNANSASEGTLEGMSTLQ